MGQYAEAEIDLKQTKLGEMAKKHQFNFFSFFQENHRHKKGCLGRVLNRGNPSILSNLKSTTIQLKAMWAELNRLEKQIAYESEEVKLRHQLAWAKVHVSEQESATLLQRIAKKNEVMSL